MKFKRDPIQIELAKILQPLCQLEEQTISDSLVLPPDPSLGEIAFGCFQSAKLNKTSPMKVAEDLAKKLSERTDVFASVTAVGPYVNFKLKSEFYKKHLLEPIFNKKFFDLLKFENPPKTMIEYSQPNTHKELHVGHLRNACLGDALVRLHRYSGFSIVSATYPGDVGAHVAKCLWYMKYRNQETVPNQGRGEWLGKMYSMANQVLEDEKESDKFETNKNQLTEILKQLENKQGDFFQLWQVTRQWSIELMQDVYDWIDIKFDKWYWESDVDAVSVQYVKKLFSEGKLIESQNAIGMDLSAENLGFCMLLKSNGTGLYATKDLELARMKFQDFQIEKSIYVVDMRQALHFKQVFLVLKKLGFTQADHCLHLQYNFVELPDGAMSSRKGNIVPLMQLVARMQEHILKEYLEKYKDEWTDTETKLIAKQIAMGAIKYGMLKIDPNKKIVFDMKEWIKIDGDSGPFIQYSVARIKSLNRKFSQKISFEKIDPNLLVESEEKQLMAHLFFFHRQVADSLLLAKPSILCTYVYELAKKFNAFYHHCSIGQAETESLKEARLYLSICVGQVLEKGLELVGIPVPEKM